ncbi:MAG: protein kinase, partial [Planctomycetota bacterium]|nr:protein kinase [Planctomycetota bacterium]
SGGMGTVYEAMQQSPRRTVALKMMRSGISSKNALRRFEYEAQALGRLRHPNIAQIYEAGSFDDGAGGRPWFAMELIVGKKELTTYCNLKKLNNRDKLQLFKQICDAVQHGHQKGIIHRDLKPSNILVTSSGVPKIIDFGVARSTDSDMAVTTLQTDIGAIIGTLQYMSPEQCAADPADIDTRSDIYALGVILYEMLCETVPYDVAKVAIHEAARIVQQEPPTKPSTLDKRLRGDIETITLKAMEKDRDRRYQSATELEQDIERYLAGEPITAKAPSAMDYLKRFTRKHKGTAASIAAIFLVLIGAVVAVSIFAYKVEQERKKSDALRQTAEEANTNLQHALDANMLYAQREADVQLQLSESVERTQDLLKEANRQAYYGNMHAAAAAVDRNETATARKRLADARVVFGNLDPEDMPFEWQHYTARNDTSLSHFIPHESKKSSWYDTSGRLESLVFNANGTRLLSCGDDQNQIHVWGASSGELLDRGAIYHHEPLQAISPNGRRQARYSIVGPVRIYDLETNEVLATLDRDDREIEKASFSEDGSRIVLHYDTPTDQKAGEDIQVWDAQNGEMLARIHGGNQANVISPDGALFGCTSLERVSPAPLIGPILVYDASTGELINKFGHQDRQWTYRSIAFDHSGARLAAVDSSRTVHLFDIRSGKVLQTMEEHEDISSVGKALAFSPDDTLLVYSLPDGSLMVWDTTTGDLLTILRGHEHACELLAFSPDGTRLATSDKQGHVRSWSLRNLRHAISLNESLMDNTMHAGVLSPDGTQLASADLIKGIQIMDLLTGELVFTFDSMSYVRAMDYNLDGTLLAVLFDDYVIVRDTRTGQLLATITIEDQHSKAIAFTLDGRIVLNNPFGDSMVNLDWKTFEVMQDQENLIGRSVKSGEAFSLSRDGQYLAVSQRHDGLVLLDAKTGEILNRETPVENESFRPQFQSDGSNVVAFSPDGTRLATDNGHNQLLIWSIPELEVLTVLEGHESSVQALAFHPDGRRLASGSRGSNIRIWDLESGENVAVLTGHEYSIESLAFNPEGTWLVSSDISSSRKWPTQAVGHALEDRHAARLRTSQLSPLVETWIQKANGDHEVLLAMLEREQRKRSPEEARVLGNVLLKIVGRNNRIQEFDDLVDKNWDKRGGLNRLAWNVMISEDPVLIAALSESCLRAAKRACELSDHQDAAYLDTLARVYFERGELDQAIHWQQKAVEYAEASQQQELTNTLSSYQADAAAGISDHTSAEPSVP